MNTQPTARALRKSLYARYSPWLGLALLALVSQPMACNCDDNTGNDVTVNGDTVNGGTSTNNGTDLAPPSIDALPEFTSEASLDVTGTKEVGIAVFVRVNGADPGDQIEGPTRTTDIDGKVQLNEGENTLTFYHSDVIGTRGISADTEAFVVVLDTTAPGQPTVTTDIPECVGDETITLEGSVEEGSTLTVNGEAVAVNDDGSFSASVPLTAGNNTVTLVAVDAAGNQSEPNAIQITKSVTTPTLNPVESPTTETSINISGTKGAGAGVQLRFEGEDWRTIVDPSPETNWAYTLDLPNAEGDNSFEIQGIDAAGQSSCGTVSSSVIVSNVCVPIVVQANFVSPTTDPEQPVAGDKCAGTGVWLRYEGEALSQATEQVPLNDEEGFAFTFTLREGENLFYIHNRDALELFSAGAGPYRVVLDTIPPEPPVFDPEPPAQTGEEELDLTGTKEEGSSICIRYDQEPNCTVVVQGNASDSFSLEVALQEGRNSVCISAIDAAGNQSEETCYTIERVGESLVSIFAPRDGSLINGDDLLVQVQASDENGIDTVEVCFDGQCAEAPNAVGTTYERLLTFGDNLENGSSYTITARATNGIGLTAEDSIRVIYLVEGFLLSDTAPEGGSVKPIVATDSDGVVHVVWADECSQFGNCDADLFDGALPDDLFYRRFDEDGWSEIVVLNDYPGGGDGNTREPSMVIDEADRVHVAWQDDGGAMGAGPDDSDIYHRFYDPETGAWSEIVVVSANSSLNDTNVSLSTAPGSGVVAVWQTRTNNDFAGDFDIFHSRYASGFWSPSLLISDSIEDGDSRNPSVAVDPQGVSFIVWQDRLDQTSDWDVYMRTLTDGAILGDIILVSDNGLDSEVSINPSVAVSYNDRTAHIVWQDQASLFNSGPDTDIFYRAYRMANPGDTNSYALQPYLLMSSDALDGESVEPTIARNTSTDGMFIGWVDTGEINNSGSDADIFIVQFEGAAGAPLLISGGESFNDTAEWPSLAFDAVGGALYIVWEDEGGANNGDDRDVFVMGVQFP